MLARLGAMLLVASVILPVLAFGGILIMRHYFLVHYERNTMLLWLLLDAAILAAGLIITENAAVKPKRNSRLSRRR